MIQPAVRTDDYFWPFIFFIPLFHPAGKSRVRVSVITANFITEHGNVVWEIPVLKVFKKTRDCFEARILFPEIDIGMGSHPCQNFMLSAGTKPEERFICPMIQVAQPVIIIRGHVQEFYSLVCHGSNQSP